MKTSVETKLRQYRKAVLGVHVLGQLVLCTVLFLLGFLLLSAVEGNYYLTPSTKTLLFISWVLVNIGHVVYRLHPLLQEYRKPEESALAATAADIGKKDASIQDRMLNWLQLKRYGQISALASAELQVRTGQWERIDYNAFFPRRQLRSILLLLGSSLLFYLLTYLTFPEWIGNGTHRFLNFRQAYLPPPPFHIIYANLKTTVLEGQSFDIDVQVKGNKLPENLFLFSRLKSETAYSQFPIEKISATQYKLSFTPLQEDIEFYVGNESYGNTPVQIRLLRKPKIQSFELALIYPAHTGRKPERLPRNIGAMDVPEGTRVNVQIVPRETPLQLNVIYNQTPIRARPSAEGYWQANWTAAQNGSYQFRIRSQEGLWNDDTLNYPVTVIRDETPTILLVEPQADKSLNSTGIEMIQAQLADDYGFSALRFVYRFAQSRDPAKVTEKFERAYMLNTPTANPGLVTLPFDFLSLGLEPGDEVEFYLEARDNDSYNGPKAGYSQVRRISYQTLDEQYNEAEETQTEVAERLNELTERQRDTERRMQELEKSIRENSTNTYERQKMTEQLMQQSQQTQQQVDQLQEQLSELAEKAEQQALFSPEVQQKLEALQQFLSQMEESTLKDLYKKLEQMARQNDPKQAAQMMEQLKEQQKALEQALERTLALFKQLRAEQKSEELQNRLQNLEERQEQLREQTRQNPDATQQQELAKRQEQLNREMEAIRKELKDLFELKKDAAQPVSPEDQQQLEQMGEKSQEQMERAQQQLQKQQPKQAGQQQQDAQQQMRQMRQKLEEMQEQQEQEQAAENAEDLRQLLENLLKVSFDQESLRDELAKTRSNDPAVIRLLQRQRNLQEDSRLIQDSLYALAKRAFQIKQHVLDQTRVLEKSIRRSVEYLTQRQIPLTTQEQTVTMATANDLANMLVESLQQMQKQMRQSKGKGSGSPMPMPMPGMGMQQLSKQQQQLNQMLQQMMDGQQPKDQPGQQGQPGKMGQAAAQQEGIRRRLKEAYEKLKEKGEGGGLGNLGQIMREMQESEEELRKGLLTQQLLERQQRILNRMLDYDKAVREREYEEQRQGKSARNQQYKAGFSTDSLIFTLPTQQEQLQNRKMGYSAPFQMLIERYFRQLNAQP